MSPIKRVGIVLKPHQPEALKTICELVVWLAERDIKLIGGPEIEREQIEHETGWRPTTTLRGGIEQTVAFHRSRLPS